MARSKRILPVLLAVALLAGGGCVLQFDSGLFQSMALHFALSQLLPEGESTVVHSIHYPGAVTIKGKWVRVSGSLMAPDGGALPDRVALESRFEDADSGRLASRVRATAQIDDGGGFSVRQKLRKNLAANTLQMIAVEPQGSGLAKGTKIWLCIDIVNKRKDLNSLPDCDAGGGDDGEPPAPGTVVVQVLDNSFEPKQVRVSPGDTVRWVLAGVNLNHTVTAMEASVFDSGFLSTAGAFFEMTFTEVHNDQTFEYLCRTHQSCCAMQGSVRVGANAPDPGDGY